MRSMLTSPNTQLIEEKMKMTRSISRTPLLVEPSHVQDVKPIVSVTQEMSEEGAAKSELLERSVYDG